MAENIENNGCSQEDSAEHEENVIAPRSFNRIWKQWKLPKTRKRNLLKLGIPEYYACITANSRKGYWYVSGMGAVNRALSKERLINSGFYDLATAYQSVHVNY